MQLFRFFYTLFLVSASLVSCSNTILADPMLSSSFSSTLSNGYRNLQQEFDFSANYSALFQVLKGPNCVTSSPVVRVACKSPNIRIFNTSHPTIVCNTTVENIKGKENEDTFYAIQCISTCLSDSDCENVYLDNDGFLGNGPFGEVEFQCAGDSIADVDAQFQFDAGNSELCAASTRDDSQLYHLAKLGVTCPNKPVLQPYVYDDFYFECLEGNSLRDPLDESGSYTCFDGTSCLSESCEAAIGRVTIVATLDAFHTQCIDATTPVAAPTPSPVLSPSTLSSDVTYSARFVASWGNLYDDNAIDACTVTDHGGIVVRCPNAKTIEFIDAGAPSVNCSVVGQGAMECFETNSANLLDAFTSASYKCTGPELPWTKVEYPKQALVSCNGNSELATVAQAVQLGVMSIDNKVYFSDTVFECGDASHQFDFLEASSAASGLFDIILADETNEFRFTCLGQASFQSGSTSSQEQALPSVSIASDRLWLGEEFTDCFTVKANIPPTSQPQQSPTISPIETLSPSFDALVSPPIVAPVSLSMIRLSPAPILAPSGPAMSPLTDRSATDTNSNSSVIIGGSVGAAVVAVLFAVVVIVVLFVRRQSNETNDNTSTEPPKPDAVVAAVGGHDPTESATETTQRNDYSMNTEKSDLSPTSNVASTATSNTTLSSRSGSRSIRTVHSENLDFKDQSRSVHVLPLVNAVHATSLTNSQLQLQGTNSLSIEATATPVSGISDESDSVRRRALDP